MLVLTRKHQEQLFIGDDITITVVRIQGNVVRIGVEAPREVRVRRGELAIRDAQATVASVRISAQPDAEAAPGFTANGEAVDTPVWPAASASVPEAPAHAVCAV
jgi:carbon storage regulator CsrA